MANKRDELKLLGEALNGSTASLGDLLDFYRPWLYRRAQAEISAPLRTKLSASDLIQKTYLRAVEGLKQFQGTTDKEFRSWLITILEHQLADVVRKYQIAQMRDVCRELSLSNCGRLEDRTQSESISDEAVEQLISAIERLPDQQRTIVRARYIEQLTFDAIAQRCQLSREQVRRRWIKAIQTLKDELFS